MSNNDFRARRCTLRALAHKNTHKQVTGGKFLGETQKLYIFYVVLSFTLSYFRFFLEKAVLGEKSPEKARKR